MQWRTRKCSQFLDLDDLFEEIAHLCDQMTFHFEAIFLLDAGVRPRAITRYRYSLRRQMASVYNVAGVYRLVLKVYVYFGDLLMAVASIFVRCIKPRISFLAGTV